MTATYKYFTVPTSLLGLLLILWSLTIPKTEVKVDTSRIQPTPQSRLAAIVDDDPQWAKESESMVTSAAGLLGIDVSIQKYTSGELLLAEMAAGKRFRLYILDNKLDTYHRVLWGPEITARIRAIQPDAIVIGLSADDDPGFMTNGAKQFLKKTTLDTGLMEELIKGFLQ